MPDANLNVSSRVKGIIFDLDGTLYRMRWFMKPLFTIRVFPHCVRLPRFLKIREKFAGIDLKSKENLLKALCQEIAVKEKTSADEIYAWVYGTFYHEFVNLMKLHRNGRPGINLVLGKLKSAGIKLGVLSDYDYVTPRLENLRINHSYFSIMTSCEASGALKPSPRPFLQIAEEWRLEPEDVLVIGDRDDTDGAGARNSGMKYMKIHEGKCPENDGCTWETMTRVLDQLSENE